MNFEPTKQLVPNLRTISTNSSLVSNQEATDHCCYLIQSAVTGRLYIGYTVDFIHRLRQHNGEIAGGAKKTSKDRPWIPICLIRGFCDNSSALRFEFRLQKSYRGKITLNKLLNNLETLIAKGDGLLPWSKLTIYWYQNGYRINSVTNVVI